MREHQAIMAPKLAPRAPAGGNYPLKNRTENQESQKGPSRELVGGRGGDAISAGGGGGQGRNTRCHLQSNLCMGGADRWLDGYYPSQTRKNPPGIRKWMPRVQTSKIPRPTRRRTEWRGAAEPVAISSKFRQDWEMYFWVWNFFF